MGKCECQQVAQMNRQYLINVAICFFPIRAGRGEYICKSFAYCLYRVSDPMSVCVYYSYGWGYPCPTIIYMKFYETQLFAKFYETSYICIYEYLEILSM